MTEIQLDDVLPNWKEILIHSLNKQGYDEETAKRIIEENEEMLKNEMIIDDEKIKEASEIRKEIENLVIDIIQLRYRINENSKMLGFGNLFENNNETSKIGHKLRDRQVINEDTFHLFIDDIHKFIIQTGNLYKLQEKHESIKMIIDIISIYRNYYDHIYDVKNGGKGSEKAYRKLAKTNKRLLGHSIIRPDDYPILQKKILIILHDMLEIINKNLEEWFT